MTNATKANVIAAINALLALLVSFGVNLSEAQTAGTVAFINALLVIWVSVTYRDSVKRVPDPPTG